MQDKNGYTSHIYWVCSRFSIFQLSKTGFNNNLLLQSFFFSSALLVFENSDH